MDSKGQSLIYLLIGLALIVLIGGAFLLTKDNKNIGDLPNPVTTITPTVIPTSGEINFFVCSSDSDCITVRADSCGCTAGGKATSINKKYLSEWEEKNPPGICPQVISQDPSCINTVPKCTSNQCQLIKKD